MYRFFLLSLNRMSMSEWFHRFRVWLLDAPQYMYINKYSSNNNHYHYQYPLVVSRGKGKRMWGSNKDQWIMWNYKMPFLFWTFIVYPSQRVQKHDPNNSIQFDYSFCSRGLILGLKKSQIFKMRLFWVWKKPVNICIECKIAMAKNNNNISKMFITVWRPKRMKKYDQALWAPHYRDHYDLFHWTLLVVCIKWLMILLLWRFSTVFMDATATVFVNHR